MTLLVAGSAALYDLILEADRHPEPSEVATLIPNPSACGQWLPGGGARTIALAAAAQGLAVRLWYPLSEGDVHLATLRLAGIDLAHAPVGGEAARCVMAYDGQRRLAWSTRRLDVAPTELDALFEGVDHLVVSPVWGDWAELLVVEANRRGIPASMIGEAPAAMRRHAWHTVILDEAQAGAVAGIEAGALVVTAGAAGARVTEAGRSLHLPAGRASVVDTTGAGDVFGGTYLARRLLGDAAAAAGAAAGAAAARTCEGWGAWAAFAQPAPAPRSASRADRIRGALAATACGDAFGMPNSFLRAPPWRTGMEPGPADSPYHAGYPAGRVTDDTEQALALTDALEEGFSPETVAKHLNAWFVSVGGENSLAVGPSTKRALIAYQAGRPVGEIGRLGVTNGAAMRISPIGVYAAVAGLSLPDLAALVAVACLPTHGTTPATAGATAIAAAVAAGVDGGPWDEVMEAASAGAEAGARHGAWIYAADLPARIALARRLAAGATSKVEVARLMSDVVGAGEPTTESVPAALGIADFARGDPHLAIEISGNLRGDTDTVAALAGAVCGAYAGEAALPAEWRELVERVNGLSIRDWAARLERAAAARAHLVRNVA